jgi:3-isopropylmalate/(R)-2-methylmalate dehydratase large subunit
MIEPTVSLTPGKRVLFLTRDPDLIRRQLAGTLDLRMEDLRVEDLMDDINTDAMTPAWACFDYRPEDIARNAYAGITIEGERLFPMDALRDGNFEAIVSGFRKGVGSSRETAVQAEKWSGIRIAIAASFAPIHARNNIAQGVLMGDHAMLRRLQKGERIPLEEFTSGHDVITQMVIEHGGLFPFTKAYARGEVQLPPPATPPRAMTLAEKILAAHTVGLPAPVHLKPGDAVCVKVDGGYSHEFTTAQVHYFLEQEYGPAYRLADPGKFAVFEDHLIYADGVPRMAPFSPKIQVLRDLQRTFQRHSGVLDYSAREGVSPGICHSVARERIIEPGDFIQATDSHTCMGGSNGALAYGVGATEYAALVLSGFTFVEVPESIRFELIGALPPGTSAKDVMLHILAHHARQQLTLDRVMEFGGPGLRTLAPDERAVLANMATECSAKAGVVEVDEATLEWLAARRPGVSVEALRAKVVTPDAGAAYAGGVHVIDLSALRPMVATPGDVARGIPSDPTNGALIAELPEVPIDIAYGGSCTAGKEADLDQYARVMAEALAAGRRVKDGVEFFIQFGSEAVEQYARRRGYVDVFEKTGVKLIHPGCGACIGCGPGVSSGREQVTVSAINRNYQNRSGPGQLYLASPFTVAASAVAGRIVAYREGMFAEQGAAAARETAPADTAR